MIADRSRLTTKTKTARRRLDASRPSRRPARGPGRTPSRVASTSTSGRGTARAGRASCPPCNHDGSPGGVRASPDHFV